MEGGGGQGLRKINAISKEKVKKRKLRADVGVD